MTGRVIVLQADATALPLPAASVDAVVCDPPYNLSDSGRTGGFMGRAWDGFESPVAFQRWCTDWAAECLRVLKPGGHLLAFGGTRTWHRLTCAIEDAGFEIRESVADLTGQDAPGLMWVQGQGFPKNHDVGKAIDKAAGAEREVTGEGDRFGRGSMRNRSRAEMGYRPTEINPDGGTASITVPATEDAARWEGWGTSLKPAWEPVVVGRKPLAAGTVAANVLEHGTGALNITGCRVGTAKDVPASPRRAPQGPAYSDLGNDPATGSGWDANVGRWPPNVLLTHSADCEPAGTRRVRGSRIGKPSGPLPGDRSAYGAGLNGARPARGIGDTDGMETVEVWDCADDCPVAELDRQSGGAGAFAPVRGSEPSAVHKDAYGQRGRVPGPFHDDEGGASRFFPVFRYAAKAPVSERPRLPDGTAWPTVKPLELMQWLVRLVTPPGGKVLDLFCGTGSTGEACIIEGFDCILLDKDPQALALTRVRLAKPIQPLMFSVPADSGRARPPGVRKPPPPAAAGQQESMFDGLEAS